MRREREDVGVKEEGDSEVKDTEMERNDKKWMARNEGGGEEGKSGRLTKKKRH